MTPVKVYGNLKAFYTQFSAANVHQVQTSDKADTNLSIHVIIITSLTLGHSFHKTAHEMERFYSGPFQLLSPNLGILSPQVSAK